jgi:hypothetical protein
MTIRLATFRLDWGMSLLIAWENNMAWINNYPEDQFASLWNQIGNDLILLPIRLSSSVCL